MIVERKAKTLLLPIDSYLYLRNKHYRKVSGKNMIGKFVGKMAREFEQRAYNGYYEVVDDFLGWDTSEIKKILNKKGLEWKDGREVEVVDVYL